MPQAVTGHSWVLHKWMTSPEGSSGAGGGSWARSPSGSSSWWLCRTRTGSAQDVEVLQRNLTALLREAEPLGVEVILMTYASREHLYGMANRGIRRAARSTGAALVDLAAQFAEMCAAGDCEELFFPDQHLGRNTALTMGITNHQMPVWDPFDDEFGGNTEAAIRDSKVLLWKGHCSVHQMFRPEHVEQFRGRYPGIQILVHPECPMEVVGQADVIGSTGRIIRAVEKASPGTRWAIGTELHLVERLKNEHPEQEIHFLSPMVCMCATMYRIDLAHLCWSLENLAAGTPVGVVQLDDETAADALKALKRMLEVT